MSEHLDLDQLADVLAGDDAARPHLADCEQCRTELARLQQALPAVTTALAGLSLPAQPADLDDRLARALRPAPVADLEQRRASRWVRPMAALSGIAAVAALVFGGIVVLGDDNGRDADRTAADSAESALKTSSTGSAYRKDGKLLAQQLPALLSGSAPVAAEAAPAAPQTLMTDKAAGGVRATEDPLARLRTTAGLAACLSALTPPGQVALPEAIDYATFEGSPALVVVLPGVKTERVDVFVVGPGCAAADAGLLYFGSFDRP